MKFFIVTNTQKEHALEISIKTALHLKKLGAIVVVENLFEKEFAQFDIASMNYEEAFSFCDVIITVGGDGTILTTACKSLNYNKPILGINVGTLGFLTTFEPNEINKLNNIINGEYYLDKRGILDIKIGDEKSKRLALNDFVVGKGSVLHTICIKIFCDDVLVNDFAGDGVIISTPTGSTAYSLSAGGPILDAKLDGIVVTPLCAHSMHSPPMVFSKKRNLKVIASANGRSRFYCSCDGREEIELDDECEIEIKISKQYMTLLSQSKTDQFKAIDKKLRGR